jgi:hypothetical protein
LSDRFVRCLTRIPYLLTQQRPKITQTEYNQNSWRDLHFASFVDEGAALRMHPIILSINQIQIQALPFVLDIDIGKSRRDGVLTETP